MRVGRFSAVLQLVAANLLWAGQGVAVKMLADSLSPLAIVLLPLYFIALVSVVLLFLHRGAAQRIRRAWKFRFEFILIGICGQLIAQAGMTLGISWSSASNAAVLSLLIPIFGASLAVWLLKERLSLLRMVVLLSGLTGIFLVSPLQSHTRSTAQLHEFAGNLLIALGCLGSAFYNVYSKRLLTYFSGLEILLFSYLSTTVFSLPLLFFVDPHCVTRVARLTPVQWSALLYLAIFLYGLSMVLFLRALKTVDVVIASASLYLTPLFGVILDYGVLGERLASSAVIGSAVILCATLVLFWFDTPLKKTESLPQIISNVNI